MSNYAEILVKILIYLDSVTFSKGAGRIPSFLIDENDIIERKTISGLLKKSELQYGRLGVGTKFLKEYDPAKHKIEVIIRRK